MATYVLDRCPEDGPFYIGFEGIEDATFYIQVCPGSKITKSENVTGTCLVLKDGIFKDIQQAISQLSEIPHEAEDEVLARTYPAVEYFFIQDSLV